MLVGRLVQDDWILHGLGFEGLGSKSFRLQGR